jgi:hypothetical protein
MTTVAVLTILIATHLWNPLPMFDAFWHRLTRMSDPDPLWTTRIDGRPTAASVMDGAVVVAGDGYVAGYRKDQFEQIWQDKTYWAHPARDVVVARLRPDDPDAIPNPQRGYSVLNPSTGDVRWTDPDADAVWVFASNIVGLSCPQEDVCVLENRDHDGGVVWRLNLPGWAHGIHGDTPHIPGLRSPAGWFADAAGGLPAAMPLFLPLVVDDRIYVVDTVAVRLVGDLTAPDRQTRVAFTGDRRLFAHADRAPAGCKYLVETFDVASGTPLWQRNGYDLDTARGAGCEPREDPLGADSRLVVNGSDDRPMLVEAEWDEPFVVWTGAPGARVLDTNGWLAVVVAADRKTVTIIDVGTEQARTIWSAQFGLDPDAAIAGNLVVIRDRDKGRLLALRLGTSDAMPVLDIKTKADVAGYGADGILLTSGRSIGYLPFSTG